MHSKIFLAFAAMCLIAFNACNKDKSVDPVGPYIQTFLEKDSVEYAFQVNGNTFASLDTVRMVFLVTNKSNSTVEFGEFIDCEYCGFSVRRGRLDIWQSGRIPPPSGIVNFRLKPGESLMFRSNWNTISDNGTFLDKEDDYPVPPGAYTVIGSPKIAQSRQVTLMLTIHVVP